MQAEKISPMPVSQADLAAYVGVSGALLTMAGDSRYGKRQLSSAASSKLLQLTNTYLEVQHAGIQGPSLLNAMQKASNQLVVKADMMRKEAELFQSRAALLQAKLDQMTMRETHYSHWLNTVDHLLSRLPDSAGEGNDRIWLEYQKVMTVKKLERVGTMPQLKLSIRLETERAKARVYQEYADMILGENDREEVGTNIAR